MLRQLARLFWRLLPGRARFAFAVEAPMVLTYDTYDRRDGTTQLSWLRHEEHLFPHEIWETLTKFEKDDEDDRLVGWQAQHGGPVFRTQKEAFQALTEPLRRDPKVVLTRLQIVGDRVVRVPFE